VFFCTPAINRRVPSQTKESILNVEKKKVKFIQAIENGNKIADMCQEFAFVNSMIQTIWKNKTAVISVLEKNGLRIKHFRISE